MARSSVRLAGAVRAEQRHHLAGGDLADRRRAARESCRSRMRAAVTESSGSAAEIGTDHLLVNADLGRRAGGQFAAEIEHGDLVADVEDQIGMMFDQQHARAAGG